MPPAPLSLTSRIAIVGSGVAGITAAAALARVGFRNIHGTWHKYVAQKIVCIWGTVIR